MNILTYDFGYACFWNYGHLIAAAIFAIAAMTAWRLKLPVWIRSVPFLLAIWAIAGFAIVQYILRINLPLELPTERFLAS